MRIFVGLACASETVARATHVSLTEVVLSLIENDHEVIQQEVVCADLDAARHKLVQYAIEAKANGLLLVDDGSVVDVDQLDTLLGTSLPTFVSAVAYTKDTTKLDVTESMQVGMAPTGVVWLPRAVLEDTGWVTRWNPCIALTGATPAIFLAEHLGLSQALSPVQVIPPASSVAIAASPVKSSGTRLVAPPLPSWPSTHIPTMDYIAKLLALAPRVNLGQLEDCSISPPIWPKVLVPDGNPLLSIVCTGNTFGGAEAQARHLQAGLEELGWPVELATNREPSADAKVVFWYGTRPPIAVASPNGPRPQSVFIMHSQSAWNAAALAVNAQFIDLVIAVSGPAARLAERTLGLPKDTVPVVWNGIPVRESPPRVHNGSKIKLGFVGRLGPEKNVVSLIAALGEMGQCATQYAAGVLQRTELHIYGTGPTEALLRRQVQELGLDSRVVFHGHVAEPPYHEFTALVLPSLFEGCPLVVLEALQADCPVLAVPHGDLALIIPKELHLAQPATSEVIANAITCCNYDIGVRLPLRCTTTAMARGYVAALRYCQLPPREAPQTKQRTEPRNKMDTIPTNTSAPAIVQKLGNKPRVALIADVPDWAFDVNERDWAEYCKDEFDFSHLYVTEARTWPDLDQKYDAVFVPYHRWPIGDRLPWKKSLGSLRCSYFIPEHPGPPSAADIHLVNQFRGYHVVTSSVFAQLRRSCPNAVYLTNPVAMQRFPTTTAITNKIVCEWNGNAKHFNAAGLDVKGYTTLIEPATRHAGIELIIAEYNTRRIAASAMPAFYHGANVALCASMYEGASNSVMEAMASGLAVISTDVGNMREMRDSQILNLGDSGILLVERTVDAFVTALEELRADPNRATYMGRLNRTEIEQRWSWEVWARRYTSFLRMAL